MLRCGVDGGGGPGGRDVLDDFIWTEQERLPTPCSPPPPHPPTPLFYLYGCSAICGARGPSVLQERWPCKWLTPSWCGKDRGEEAASRLPPPGRHTSCRLWGLERRPGPQRGALASPQASLSYRPSPLDPSLCRQPPACAHCGLSLITWACPRHHLVLVFEGLVGRRQGDIYGGDQEAFGHPLEAPPAAS